MYPFLCTKEQVVILLYIIWFEIGRKQIYTGYPVFWSCCDVTALSGSSDEA